MRDILFFTIREKEVLAVKRLVTDPAKCTGCRECEKVCSEAYFKTADREKSAIRISAGESGGFEIDVCDQCGVCREMCTIMALSAAGNGVVRLDRKTCVGCLVCVGECLRGYMRYCDDLPAPFKCVACGLCVKQCTAGALKVEG